MIRTCPPQKQGIKCCCVPATHVGCEVRHGDFLSDGRHQLLSQHGFHVGPGATGLPFGLYVGDLQVLTGVAGPQLGLHVGHPKRSIISYHICALIIENIKGQKQDKSLKSGHVCTLSPKRRGNSTDVSCIIYIYIIYILYSMSV